MMAAVISAAAMFAASDRRFKEDVEFAGTVNMNNFSIPLYRFRYKEWTGLPRDPMLGVMADELEPVLPEAVSTDENGYKYVNYGKLVDAEVVAHDHLT